MIVIIISMILVALRIVGIKSAIYQAIAHIFVGGLGGMWIVNRKPLYLGLVIGLSIIETLCAILL